MRCGTAGVTPRTAIYITQVRAFYPTSAFPLLGTESLDAVWCGWSDAACCNLYNSGDWFFESKHSASDNSTVGWGDAADSGENMKHTKRCALLSELGHWEEGTLLIRLA